LGIFLGLGMMTFLSFGILGVPTLGTLTLVGMDDFALFKPTRISGVANLSDDNEDEDFGSSALALRAAGLAGAFGLFT